MKSREVMLLLNISRNTLHIDIPHNNVTDMTQLYIQVNQIVYIPLTSFLNQLCTYLLSVSKQIIINILKK